jgi:hypothetical protein
VATRGKGAGPALEAVMIGRDVEHMKRRARRLAMVAVVATLAVSPGRAMDLDPGERGWMMVSCQAWHQRIVHRVEDQERAGTIWVELAEDVRVTLARLSEECPRARDRGMLKRMVALVDLLSEIEDEQ